MGWVARGLMTPKLNYPKISGKSLTLRARDLLSYWAGCKRGRLGTLALQAHHFGVSFLFKPRRWSFMLYEARLLLWVLALQIKYTQ